MKPSKEMAARLKPAGPERPKSLGRPRIPEPRPATPHLLSQLDALEMVTNTEPLFRFHWPMVLPSRANASRGQSKWAALKAAQTVKKQRSVGRHVGEMMAMGRKPLIKAGGAVVRIVRVAPRLLDAAGNLEHSAKALIDGIADAFGVDDRDSRVRYVVDQAKGPAAVEAYLYARRAE